MFTAAKAPPTLGLLSERYRRSVSMDSETGSEESNTSDLGQVPTFAN